MWGILHQKISWCLFLCWVGAFEGFQPWWDQLLSDWKDALLSAGFSSSDLVIWESKIGNLQKHDKWSNFASISWCAKEQSDWWSRLYSMQCSTEDGALNRPNTHQEMLYSWLRTYSIYRDIHSSCEIRMRINGLWGDVSRSRGISIFLSQHYSPISVSFEISFRLNGDNIR